MKFIDKVKKFMYGRYGSDELSLFLMKLYFMLFLINIFLKSSIVNVIEVVFFIIIIYRIFSKKIYDRNDENVKFLKLKKKVLKPFNIIKKNIKDKEHLYRRCKHCKKLMKLPIDSKMGIKYAKCPKCNKTTRVLVLKRQKIEIISKKK